MNVNAYLGHPSQISGVEEHRLVGGKGDGIRLLEVRNGKGLELTVSLDRCADISRLTFNGKNVGFFSACGYVSPAYYEKNEFLQSFTAGFMTTCGLTAVGTPGVDDGEDLPLHGTVHNIPAESSYWYEKDGKIVINATMRDASIFGRKLVLRREYIIDTENNTVKLHDEITNEGTKESPICLLYHCNMGYPMLSENTKLVIPFNSVKPRNERAAEGIDNALVMEKPQPNFDEQCYFFDVKADEKGIGKIGLYNPDAKIGMVMSFDKSTLDYFTEWKMMGEGEYVLGVEPGNCTPDGRAYLREHGMLKFLAAGATYTTDLEFSFTACEKEFDAQF